jgi:hypothetical protein
MADQKSIGSTLLPTERRSGSSLGSLYRRIQAVVVRNLEGTISPSRSRQELKREVRLNLISNSKPGLISLISSEHFRQLQAFCPVIRVPQHTKNKHAGLEIGRGERSKSRFRAVWMHAASGKDRATRPIHDSARHRETQARPILAPRYKEWFEDVRNVGYRNADSVVGESHSDTLNRGIRPVRCFAHADSDSSP